MQQLKRDDISEAEAKEITEFVQDVIQTDYATFSKIRADWGFPWYWGKIMKFFRMPKTELHKKYMEWCRKPAQEIREKSETWKILWKMDDMRNKLMNDNNLTEAEVKYQIIRRQEIRHKFWGADEVLTIWIPYFDNQEKRCRYYWTINVYQTKTPELFKKICDTFRRFVWEPEIMLH